MPESVRPPNTTQKLLELWQERIASGQWRVGTRLPTARALAMEFSVSVNTVQRALGQLQAMGQVEIQGGRVRTVKSRSVQVVPAAPRSGTHVAILRSTSQPPDKAILSRSWSLQILESIEQTLSAQGLKPTFIMHDRHDARTIARLRANLQHLGKDLLGTILFPPQQSDQVMATLDAMEVPWVTINHATARTSHNFVTADFPGAGRHVGWCFAKLGYERVMLLGVPLASSTSWSELVGGFTQGYLVGGMNFPGMVHVECEADNGAAVFAAVSERLKGHAAPKGIFAFGDLTSLEAIRACREVGLRVPQDVAVVGATGLEMSRYTDPPLSTIAQPLERIGYEAVNLLIEVARLGTRRIPGRVISAPLILRASVHVPDELKQVLREKVDLADSDDYDAVHSS